MLEPTTSTQHIHIKTGSISTNPTLKIYIYIYIYKSSLGPCCYSCDRLIATRSKYLYINIFTYITASELFGIHVCVCVGIIAIAIVFRV
jgi:hypothetical protein